MRWQNLKGSVGGVLQGSASQCRSFQLEVSSFRYVQLDTDKGLSLEASQCDSSEACQDGVIASTCLPVLAVVLQLLCSRGSQIPWRTKY
jgi:hypothetical protein